MRQIKIEQSTTFRSQNLNRYMTDVSPIKVMDPAEEYEVAKLAREGDPDAIDTLVQANLRFVISVAKMYSRKGLYLEDLINEGNIGLVEAAQDFEPATGFKFISYAVWHIRKNMIKFLTDKGRTVKLPQNKVATLSKMKRVESDLASQLGRNPVDWEIFDEYTRIESEAGRDYNRVTESSRPGLTLAIVANQTPKILDQPDPNDSDREWGPINTIDGSSEKTDWLVTRSSQSDFIEDILSGLNKIDQDVIRSYYGIGKLKESFKTISHRYECSLENIRQKHKKAMKRLQHRVRSRDLTLSDII